MSRKDDVLAGARQMPDFDKLAEICRKPIEDTRPLEPSDLIVKQAFSVKWIWGWLEMHGYKTTEYRSSPQRYRLRGRCAVHFSSSAAFSAMPFECGHMPEKSQMPLRDITGNAAGGTPCLAEGGGFEPPVELPPHNLSKVAPSTTRTPFHVVENRVYYIFLSRAVQPRNVIKYIHHAKCGLRTCE